MKPYVKYLNIVVFLVLLVFLVLIAPYKKLSTNLISLLPQNEETKLLKIYENFQSSREILVSIKGENLTDIQELEKRVLKNSFIELKKNFFTNKEFRSYIKKYSFYLQNFDSENIENIDDELKKSYQNLISNPYYSTINKDDPLKLFSQKTMPSLIELKKGHMFLKDFGYMSIFTFKRGTPFEKVYDVFGKELSEDVKVFSPIFYFVENSHAIKSQVNFLVFAAITILLLLYVVVLKNLSLLVNTLLTLFSSSIFSLLIVTLFWSEVSIFVLVFGMAVSTVAIDYMFHHYFCGFYEKNRGFNKSVFFGFLSTLIAFMIISFVDFPFIKQVSVYTFISLSFSYFIFAFVFPRMGFKTFSSEKSLPLLNILKPKSYKYIVFILLVFIAYSSLHVKMDLDIKNLDYENVKVKSLEDFFRAKLDNSDKIPFIIKAKTIDKLIQKNTDFKALHVEAIVPLSNLLSSDEFMRKSEKFAKIDFLHLKDEVTKKADLIGFRKGYFRDSYGDKLLNPGKPEYTLESVNEFGFDVVYDEGFYYSYGFVKNEDKSDGIYLISSTKLFQNSLQSIYDEILICGILIMLSIILILHKVTKQNFFKAFTYILFPISLSLFVMSLNPVNILQLFMLFVIVSLSIDYGIYMSEKDVHVNVKRAIIFSLMSTFAGFGILVFSTVGVLFYIGQVATVGLFAIFILLVLGSKDEN